MPVSGAFVAGFSGRSNVWRRARTTWIASPAAIASFATSTARSYSSRPRLDLDPVLGNGRAAAAPRGAAAPISAADGRAVRSSASKIAVSAIR